MPCLCPCPELYARFRRGLLYSSGGRILWLGVLAGIHDFFTVVGTLYAPTDAAPGFAKRHSDRQYFFLFGKVPTIRNVLVGCKRQRKHTPYRMEFVEQIDRFLTASPNIHPSAFVAPGAVVIG